MITRSAAKKDVIRTEIVEEPPKKKRKVATNKQENETKKDVKNVCPSTTCNHMEEEQNEDVVEMIGDGVETVDELINLGRLYHCKNRKSFKGVNLRIICKIIPELEELERMIGLEEAKLDIVQQILYFSQKNGEDCGKCFDCKDGGICIKNINCDMLHTIITGPPGVGKTSFGKILCKIYTSMGILSKGTFTIARRSDLIGEFLGQTAAKTQRLIDKSTGGVLFIDEFYSLGCEDKNDSYSKECIDTLTLNASENKDIIFFVAGYKIPIYECVFAQNEGLRRRFAFEYELPSYNGIELSKILLNIMKSQGLKFEDQESSQLQSFIIEKKDVFKYNGGDMETLLLYVKIHMRKRLIFKLGIDNKLIILDDIKMGYNSFLKHRAEPNIMDSAKAPPAFMYI